jgi:hypothetical protein
MDFSRIRIYVQVITLKPVLGVEIEVNDDSNTDPCNPPTPTPTYLFSSLTPTNLSNNPPLKP